MRILLIEDTTTCATLLLHLLEGTDLEVEADVVVSQAEALAHLAHEHYDLIILDLTLIDAPGVPSTVTTIVRAGHGTPILVYSGVSSSLEPEILSNGAAAYLSKDTEPHRVLEVVRRLLPHGRTFHAGH